MKSYKLSIPLLALLLQSTFANTYVWEDYDDFSGSTLDTVKWDLSCFDGGNLPIISNGQVLLAGNTNSSWNDIIGQG